MNIATQCRNLLRREFAKYQFEDKIQSQNACQIELKHVSSRIEEIKRKMR